ncbi:RTA1 like protein-domain-containing protein [Phaeosphaeriaceae sp. PMI808]|nr:RTA1 like protein-domain-containing protein [Phaeosphaeriaceae sp. PMI808]
MSHQTHHPALNDPNAWVPYRYSPSNVAAIIFVTAFFLTTFLHIVQLVKKKTWYFIPFVIGGLLEASGYIGRIISHNDLWALGPYIMQSLLILIAPALLAASIYIILGRIISLVDGQRYLLVPQRWLTKVFVAGDVLSFMLQGAGGGIQSGGTLKKLHTGEKIIIVGLFVQLSFFAFFVFVAGNFHYRLVNNKPLKKYNLDRDDHTREHGRHHSSSSRITPPRVSLNDLPFKRHIYNLYLTSAIIMVRSLFRVIEYIQGNAGYLLSQEVYLYIFDALLMFTVMILFNWFHPSEITAAYEKRKTDTETQMLSQITNKYLNPDAE